MILQWHSWAMENHKKYHPSHTGDKLADCDYLFPLDRFPKKLHDIFALTVCGLEAFGPCNKDTLKRAKYYVMI